MRLNDYDPAQLIRCVYCTVNAPIFRALNHDNNTQFKRYLGLSGPRHCMDTIMTTQTITVLYYPAELAIKPLAEVLYDLEVGVSGRVIIPMEYKEDKIIVAVFKGEVELLNALGDRVASEFNDVA